ncbi:hypothetical protein ACP70R_037263 [Stipagrostis hirtigluma subsp. patula]
MEPASAQRQEEAKNPNLDEGRVRKPLPANWLDYLRGQLVIVIDEDSVGPDSGGGNSGSGGRRSGTDGVSGGRGGRNSGARGGRIGGSGASGSSGGSRSSAGAAGGISINETKDKQCRFYHWIDEPWQPRVQFTISHL